MPNLFTIIVIIASSSIFYLAHQLWLIPLDDVQQAADILQSCAAARYGDDL